MVSHSRASLRSHQLRPLNSPHPVNVFCNDLGLPTIIDQRGRRRKVKVVKDRWRIDDEWWRVPLSRLYYLVECGDGTLETVYFDLANGHWYQQRDSYVR